MYWGVPAEVEIGYTSWWNLINQLVNGPSWVSAQELICRQNNKENPVCGAWPGPTDQGWPLGRKRRPHCYTEHRDLPVPCVCGMCGYGQCRHLRASKIWAPIRPPTQLHRFHKSTGRETWWAAPFQRRHFQGPKNVKKRLSQECCGPSSASGIHTKPLAWPHLKPSRAQGLLSSPTMEDWSLVARNAQSRSRGNMRMVAEPHKVLSEVNIKHCEHREGGAMDSM